MGSQLYSSSNMGLGLSQLNTQIPSLPEQNQPSTDLLRLGGTGGRVHFDHFVPPTNRSSLLSPTASSTFFLGGHNQDFQESQSHHPLLPNKPFHGLMQLPHELQNSTATSSSAAAASVGNLFNLGFFSTGSSSSKISSSNEASHQNPHLMVSEQFSSRSANAEQAALLHRNLMRDDHMGSGESSLYDASVQSESVFPQISATALLQKAAQIGATTSSSGSFLLRGFESSYSSSSATPTTNYRANFGSTSERESMRTQIESETRLQHLMNSLADGNVGIDVMSSGAEAAFRGSCTGGGHEEVTAFGGFNTSLCNMDEAKLSRNLSSMGRMAGSDRLTRDFLGIGSMVRSMGGGMSQREPHHGIDVAYSEMKSGSTSRPFEGHNL
uniref:Mediator of RNA polymerase II transcription subunit 8 n=1 Tax=Anthurium amnicola TaxID=1678845 RepID=A0A1D1ZBX8_9ARAE